MRASCILSGIALSLAICATGCGEKKPAKDPSETGEGGGSSSGTDDTPKWDSSSETAAAARKPKPSSSDSSDSSSDDDDKPKPVVRPVQEGQKVRTDQYDKEQTDVVLNRAARQVKGNCGATKGDDGKATGPWGKLTVQVMLGHNGHAKGTNVPSPYGDKPVGSCIQKAFANLTFPPWAGSDTEVPVEVELVQPAGK